MEANIPQAIIAYVANEYHLDADGISNDLNFEQDLSISSSQVAELITRMQEALDFTLVKDDLESIHTLGDLFTAVGYENEESDSELE